MALIEETVDVRAKAKLTTEQCDKILFTLVSECQCELLLLRGGMHIC